MIVSAVLLEIIFGIGREYLGPISLEIFFGVGRSCLG